jgi:hypothetical protein
MVDNLSDQELRTELKRRQQEAQLNRIPKPLAEPDWTDLKKVCEEYIAALAKDYYPDEDFGHYIYEAALEAIYGPDVWGFINHPKPLE